MSLQKKIALSFFISSFIIALLTAIEYINFIDIRKEIRNLEIADTMRSQSLQLRRHEKNFFLYPSKAAEDAGAVYRDVDEMNAILGNYISAGRAGGLLHLLQLRDSLREYRQRFNKIETSVAALSEQFGDAVKSRSQYRSIDPLIQLTFREHPLQAAEFLESASQRTPVELIEGLNALDSEIRNLRKNGEDIMGYTTEMDRYARGNVEHVISISQIAILVVFPLFFISGIGTLFFISRNMASRLKLLAACVERTGKGHFAAVDFPENSKWGDDEVGVLIKEFNVMETQLAQREEELRRKNEELLQSRKLAAIGTLASGVAHELANPLNNIYISAQILEKEASHSCSPIVLETMHDIIGQTIRVKRIVGDLLEFARGKDLRVREVDLREVIMGAYKLVSTGGGSGDMDFTLDVGPGVTVIEADPEQLERVFINLFANAADAMQSAAQRSMRTRISREGDKIIITVSDSGSGIPADNIDKIFEPFYSTKDKGTGLGLAIVFNIIKKHDGEIRVESAKGKGTTFFITLPVTLRGNTDDEL
ncbi:MAG: GHKL domain-containing protein [Nitrospirae bacterium]|nr:GHKL domain-containing protein [Nitrospirota bacterium]